MDKNLSKQYISRLVEDQYNIVVKDVEPLSGYDNLNYRITDINEISYVLKIHPENADFLFYKSESLMLDQLNKSLPSKFQQSNSSRDGSFVSKTENGDEVFIHRMFTWLDGGFLAQTLHDQDLFISFGKFLANMDIELLEMNDPIINARHIDWDIQYFMDLRSKSKSISDSSIRKLVDYFFLQFKEFVFPELPHLRKSIIHNDANDWNVLVQNGEVTGLIDFGDMVYAPLIQELAVALTYALMDKEDPLEWATIILKSYHNILPLEEKEIDLLYYLIAARLCMSLIHSYHAIKEGGSDEYTLISQKPAIEILNKWITISPDKASNIFRGALGFTIHEKTNYAKEIKQRNVHIGKVLSVSYEKPIKMKRAAFQYMFDTEGNTFLDAYNNIPHVGHQHPKVVEAGQRQMALLNTNTRYLYDQLAAYADKLLLKFPAPLNKVFFVNSGSAASDLAIRLAQTCSGKQNIVVMEHGYHGHTRLGVDISHYKFGGRGGAGQKDYILKAPIPDTFRGEFKGKDAGKKYASQLSNTLNNAEGQIAAFIAEPIVGCGGQVPLAPSYLKEVHPLIRKQGGVCISDEVQTGFGRIGTHFWGFEAQGVVPDIVVLGKPMGNGHPIGAVVTTDIIAEAFDNGMEFFSSFGGNPVSCEIGMAVLDVIEEEKLQQNALETGNYFLKLLRDLQKEFPVIGDVRGSGLFLGVELVKDLDTLEPNTKLAQFLKNKLRENFILISTDGPFDNVIKMKPPLCFSKDNSIEVAGMLEKFLKSC